MTAAAQQLDEKKPRLEDLIKEAGEASVGAPIDLDDEEDGDEPQPEKPLPDWATLPAGMKTPAGWQVWFLRFPANLTNNPGKGDRTCILWNLSEADEKLAAKRARGDGLRVIDECAKQMIRAVDGVKADWSGASGPGSVASFWSELGGKGRHQIKGLYLRTHTMSPEENAAFFERGVVVRTAT